MEKKATVSKGDSWVRAKFPGMRIIDAVKSGQWKVGMNDNQTAQRKDPHNCGLANAIAREEGLSHDQIIVMRTRAYVVYKDRKGSKGVAVRYVLPERTRQAVIDNDRVGWVKPGSYTFSAPPPASRIGAPRNRGTARGPHRKTRAEHLGMNEGPVPGVRNAIRL